jgi:hypothetical protein
LPDDRFKRGRWVLEASMKLEVDGHHALLLLLLSRVLKIISFFHHEWHRFE